jgi:hypothetical protein
MQNLSSIDSLPKRFLWLKDFPWSIETFVEGRMRLEKLTSTESAMFERLATDTKQVIIALQATLDYQFYYEDLSSFRTTYAPEKLNRVPLRNALFCVSLMRKERRPGLTRDTVPMVGLEWYSDSLTRLFKLKDPHARVHMHTFLEFDYTAEECAPLCKMAYLEDLKDDPEYAPQWLSAMIGHPEMSDLDECGAAPVWLGRVPTGGDALARSSPATEDLLRLLEMHPDPERAWKLYYESVLISTVTAQGSEAGSRYTFDQILGMCMEQLAYGNAMDQQVIWRGWVAAFPTILAYARDQVPNDQAVTELELIGWQVLDITMGSSIAAGKALGLDVLELFAALPPLGTDMEAALPELTMSTVLSAA